MNQTVLQHHGIKGNEMGRDDIRILMGPLHRGAGPIR